MTRRDALRLLALGAAGAVAGCGLKGDLERPPDKITPFPRSYPRETRPLPRDKRST